MNYQESLYRIEAPHFVAGFVLRRKGEHLFAPILGYMRNWTLTQIEIYCQRKEWKLKELKG
jgi:hypothetical protein